MSAPEPLRKPRYDEGEVHAWLEAHVSGVRELSIAANRASWEAATTGSAEAVTRSAEARTAVKRLYSDAGDAARVKSYLAEPRLRDPQLRRQLELLDLSYTANQLPGPLLEELSRREAELEQTFYTHRARLAGEPVSDNRLLELLRSETDNARRREVWDASKQIGAVVAEPLRELVRRRNAAARTLGYDNYHSMELALQEIDEDFLFALLDEFRAATDAPFRALRAEMDAALAARYGVAADAVRPWHWEDFFSQEAPSVGEVDLDPFFRGRNLVGLAADYFRAIDLPVDDVLERSDLYEREGKDQHAFCTDIDRAGDVRVLCNMRDNEKWMGTLLHELGHAAYDRYLPASLPFLLRSPAHTLSTEAIAMLFGRLTRDPAWLREVVGAELTPAQEEDVRRQLRMAMLVSARWILVMAYFERALYRDPDMEDLNSLWWDLVESIQMVRRPEGRDAPDWAAKLHLSLAPVYYHNYLLGELMASQLDAAMRAQVGPATRAVDPAIGRFLREAVFAAGATRPWNELLVAATGERLSPRFFVAQFV